MECEVALAAIRWGFQGGEFSGNGGEDSLLDFLLQFLAGGRFERGNRGVRGMSDESALRLGLDAIGELRDQALEIHGVDFSLDLRG